MSLTGDSESLLTCAPLWHINTTSIADGKIEYTTKSYGRCSLMNKNLDVVHYSFSPCETGTLFEFLFCKQFSSANVKIKIVFQIKISKM